MKIAKLSAVLMMAVIMATATVTSCKNGGGSGSASGSDSTTTAVDSASLPELKPNESINRAARFYAGIAKDGVTMQGSDAQAWEKYSNEINGLLKISKNTRTAMDSLAKTDFSDFRDKVDMVFYPFSGADFLYPITLFPNADTFVLCGLEKAGSAFGDNIKSGYALYESYRKGLATFLKSSFFVTKDMVNDFDNDQLDGVCPVIAMLMATADYQIISIDNKAIDENGKLIDGQGKGNVVQFKFFRTGSKHEQTLYYVSADIEDNRCEPKVNKFFETMLAGHTVGSYLKAASYLMHQSNFSHIRDCIVNNSQFIVEDDSGVPYKYLTDKFDITFYGIYKRPLAVFTDACIQPDLDQAYKDNAGKVKPLPFRIGYNNPSNWLCARRKASK